MPNGIGIIMFFLYSITNNSCPVTILYLPIKLIFFKSGLFLEVSLSPYCVCIIFQKSGKILLGGVFMGRILGYYIMPHPPIIIHDIGKGEEREAIKTIEACKSIANKVSELKPETIIIITPHGPIFRDAVAISVVEEISGSFERFRAPQVKLEFPIDMKLSENIVKASNIPVVPITSDSLKEYGVNCELDHGAMVPLHFIYEKYKGFKLVHITYGMIPGIDLYRFGMTLKKAVEDGLNNAVIIASGDLSHRLKDDGPYGYNPMGGRFDNTVIDILIKGEVLGIFNMDKEMIEGAGECGLRSFYIMLGAMDGEDLKGNLLSYEGPFGIGYGVMSFDYEPSNERKFLERLSEMKKTRQKRKNENPYVRLARESLEYYIRENKEMKIPDYVTSEMLDKKRGVFVSLKKDGILRGCIGTIFPTTDNTALEIIRNSVEAGQRDPRFYPVEEEELLDIDYSVDVLSKPIACKREELNPKKYGVIVRRGKRTGLLLPALEGVNTIDEQIGIALKKAGIGENEEYTIEKFEVIRYR